MIWPFRRRPMQLACMRLDRMIFTRPDQDDTRFCSECGARVGIYPSGQAILRRYPKTTIVCNVCSDARGASLSAPAPGAIEEARERWK